MVNRPLASLVRKLAMGRTSTAGHRANGRLAGLLVGVFVLVAIAVEALAQQPTRPSAPAQPDRAAREQELESVRAEQRRAAENEAQLKSEIAAIGENRRKLNE